LGVSLILLPVFTRRLLTKTWNILAPCQADLAATGIRNVLAQKRAEYFCLRPAHAKTMFRPLSMFSQAVN
jgi:hypothetical protein